MGTPVVRGARLFAVFLLVALLAPGGLAQDKQRDDEEVVRVRTDLVSLPVSVIDSRGHRVQGLSRSDFQVRDNNRPVELAYFAQGTARVAVTFALDESGSMREVAARQRQTALELFSHFGRGSEIAVLRFADRPELVVPFTARGEAALPASLFSVVRNRHTAIFDAAAAAVRLYRGRPGGMAERRIVILVSDGLDTASTTSFRSVISEAHALSVSIYVIHLPLFAPANGRLERRPAAKGFRELAERTGGRYLIVGDVKSALDPRAANDLTPVFEAIEEDLRGQYVLGYYPPESAREPGFHSVNVGLTRNSGKFRVNSLRDGYVLNQ